MGLKSIFSPVLCCAVMIVLFGNVAHAQNITITFPKEGATWYIGKNYNITWIRSGDMDSWVKIRLRDSTGMENILSITDKTPNNPGTNTYTWMIPNSIPPGDYRIRVRTTDNEYWEDSPVFSILKPLPDLVVQQGGVTPKHPDQGDKVRFEALIRNKGRARSTSAFDALIRVTGPKGFKPIEKTFRVKPLERNETTKIFLNYLCSHWGIVRVQVKLDLKNEIKESDKDNNERIFLHGVDPLPDLVVCMQSPISIRVLNTKKVGVRVVNRGTGRSPASRLRWYVRQNGVVWRDVPPLDPGQGEVFHRDIKFPTRGSKIMRATIDPENQVKELNPDNNTVEGAAVAFLPHEFDSTGLKTWVCSDGGK